ncbi:amino acid adenylation domain-containing protein [Pseudaminobacter arsenicus]|uniref:Amino acid adenylation domain-containing protein n=1 Tax=Borborobacter arsenicus TaxID=1851146 RepID=A0A432V7T3_9HYPH|nr:non-ribosomal peptide synthetase [Pseudaminobacter arsenicus]RUM98228.1 amino acid adenylation domain-containing protein [Pseudaminobacter arsenicus]
MDAKPAAACQTGAPLTEAQTGLWYTQRIDPTNPILNTGQYLDIAGPLDIEAFRDAVDRTVREAEALALRFEDGPDGPLQVVDPARLPFLEIVDLTASPDPQAEALAAIEADTNTPLDLSRDRLAAFLLYRLSPDRHFFYERIHHLAIDGFGMVLVTNRVAEHYACLVNGTEPAASFPPLQVTLDDDRAYAASPKRETDRAFWHEEMAGLEPVTGMAPGRAISSPRFKRESLYLPAVFMERLLAFAADAKVTWPDALTALVAAYCRRFAGTDEIVIGVPHMGRLGNAAARVPCMLMNVLPLRVMPDEAQPLGDYLIDMSKRLMRARRHGRYRSEQLRRDLGLVGGQRRLYGPLVNVQPFDLPPTLPGLDVTLNILGAGAVDDITFTFRGDARTALLMEVDSNPALYSVEATKAHSERLAAFLTSSMEAAALADVPTACATDVERYLVEANRTEHEVPDTTLAALIEAKMRATPDAPALVHEDTTLSYADLDRRTAALAAELKRQGAGRDRIVAVALPRSVELVVALVASLRAGAAYLPLDLDNPPQRLARIVASAKPVCVLAEPGNEAFAGAKVLPPESWPIEPYAAELETPAPGGMAYVIYTSGSTGEPKGVVIEHRAIVNRLEWMRTHYGFTAADRFLQKTPATFDVSVWEFFLPLITGATLVVVPPGAHRDPTAIAALVRRHEITTLHFVPSMLSAFLASPASQGLSVARTFCSGEELTAEHRDRFHDRIEGELHNLYGPTEAAVDVSYWPAGPDDDSAPVPIGFPVWNTRLYVLDELLRPLPPGVAGHLYLAGVQLARCYLGRPDLTEERFVPDPFRPGERMYKTGDLARLREDGAVVYLGRSDHQVKIRGLRIELGEVEAAIAGSALVSDAAVIVREDRPGDKRIVAYVVPTDAYEPERLRSHMAARLADYMVPSAVVEMNTMPVSANGKLDRKTLPAPSFEAPAARAPATPTEAALCRLVAEVLGLEALPDPDADFFNLGGDSLLAVHLLLRVQEHFGFDPGLGVLFEHPTIATLAASIDADRVHDSGLEPVIRLRAGGDEKPPLFIVHPAGGLAWGYRTLARSLAAGRAVYGLQSPAIDPDTPLPDSLDTLAADYAGRIADLCPEGPYHLAGWSVGGIIAHAMAVHLQARGKKVGVVAMLDSYPAECWRAEPEPDETAALRALLAIAGHDPNAHPELTTREAIVAFLRAGDSSLGNLPGAALDGVVRVVLDTNRLVRNHYHSHYEGTVTHIRAGLDHKDRPELVPDLWLAHAAGLDRIEVPFLHPQLTTPAASALIAPELDRWLAQYD